MNGKLTPEEFYDIYFGNTHYQIRDDKDKFMKQIDYYDMIEFTKEYEKLKNKREDEIKQEKPKKMNQEKNTFDKAKVSSEENNQPILVCQLVTYDNSLTNLNNIVNRLIEKVDYLDKFTDEQRDELVNTTLSDQSEQTFTEKMDANNIALNISVNRLNNIIEKLNQLI